MVQNHPIDVDDAIMGVKYIEITVDISKDYQGLLTN